MPIITSAVDDSAAALAAFVREARIITGFTGAGISTECGVPDFRSPGSPWMVNKPIPFAAFVASAEARNEAWRRKFVMDDSYANAEPGQGHAFLTMLHRCGLMPKLITQNIDGLHQRSGIPADDVIELHGNGSYATCLTCAERHELAWIRPRFEASRCPPACLKCNGILKSATISFGQAMPERELRQAAEAALAADLFLAIGSSLVVFPAADLPRGAQENGAKLVIINREATGLDRVADLIIRADIGPVLSGAQRILEPTEP